MQRIDVAHHKLIVVLIMLVVLVTGILFGIRISSATQGTDGLSILIFALVFLSIVLLFILFIQIVHLHDDIARLHEDFIELGKKKR